MRFSRTIAANLPDAMRPLPASPAWGSRERRRRFLQSVLGGLDRAGLEHLASRLRLEGHRLLGERVDPLALLGGGLLDDDELREPGQHEEPVLLQLLVAG